MRTAAPDGEAALEQSRSFAPDLVILDLGLPKIAGRATSPGRRSSAGYEDHEVRREGAALLERRLSVGAVRTSYPSMRSDRCRAWAMSSSSSTTSTRGVLREKSFMDLYLSEPRQAMRRPGEVPAAPVSKLRGMASTRKRAPAHRSTAAGPHARPRAAHAAIARVALADHARQAPHASAGPAPARRARPCADRRRGVPRIRAYGSGGPLAAGGRRSKRSPWGWAEARRPRARRDLAAAAPCCCAGAARRAPPSHRSICACSRGSPSRSPPARSGLLRRDGTPGAWSSAHVQRHGGVVGEEALPGRAIGSSRAWASTSSSCSCCSPGLILVTGRRFAGPSARPGAGLIDTTRLGARPRGSSPPAQPAPRRRRESVIRAALSPPEPTASAARRAGTHVEAPRGNWEEKEDEERSRTTSRAIGLAEEPAAPAAVRPEHAGLELRGGGTSRPGSRTPTSRDLTPQGRLRGAVTDDPDSSGSCPTPRSC